jgi:hypothetical protein
MRRFMLRSLHQYCYSVDHVKEKGKDGNIASMGEIRSEYKIFIRTSKEKIPLGIPRGR